LAGVAVILSLDITHSILILEAWEIAQMNANYMLCTILNDNFAQFYIVQKITFGKGLNEKAPKLGTHFRTECFEP
jgi:hypothetical protein